MEQQIKDNGIIPISMEEVISMIQAEEEAQVAGPGKKAEKSKKGEQPGISTFFQPQPKPQLDMCTFPSSVASPQVKVKSPSAVFGAAFIESGVSPRNLSVSF